MAGIYVDTPALGRVLLAEPDAAAIDALLSNYEERWSSSLLSVELGRLGKAQSMERNAAEQLQTIRLLPVTEARLAVAAAIDPPQVRSLDAIHLAAAVELHTEAGCPPSSRSTSSSPLAASTTALVSSSQLELPAWKPDGSHSHHDPRLHPPADAA